MVIRKGLMLGLLGLLGLAHAQSLDLKFVPAVVQEAFRRAYPASERVEWVQDAPEYEVSFQAASGKQLTVAYDETGNMKWVREAIDWNAVPVGGRNQLSQHYRKFQFVEGYKVTQQGKILYEVIVRVKGNFEGMVFDFDGNIVAK